MEFLNPEKYWNQNTGSSGNTEQAVLSDALSTQGPVGNQLFTVLNQPQVTIEHDQASNGRRYRNIPEETQQAFYVAAKKIHAVQKPVHAQDANSTEPITLYGPRHIITVSLNSIAIVPTPR